MHELIQGIIDNPTSSLLVIGNLVLMESLLSVDNAAVLATMVLKLPPEQRKKALKYGIFGAYLFRGICLFLASYLVKIWWLKALGGVYLLYLSVSWWMTGDAGGDDDKALKEGSYIFRAASRRVGQFWATVISVEIMDLAFSLDNVFAAVAFSDNVLIIIIGVFIGILAMRFVAQGFVKLIEVYPFLEACAYGVIGFLGIKLVLSLVEHFYPESTTAEVLASEAVDWITSAITISVFFLPMLSCALFGYPRKKPRKSV